MRGSGKKTIFAGGFCAFFSGTSTARLGARGRGRRAGRARAQGTGETGAAWPGRERGGAGVGGVRRPIGTHAPGPARPRARHGHDAPGRPTPSTARPEPTSTAPGHQTRTRTGPGTEHGAARADGHGTGTPDAHARRSRKKPPGWKSWRLAMVVCGVQSNDEGLASLTLLACGGAHAADMQLSLAVVADILVVDPDFDGSAVAESLYNHTGMGLACASAPSKYDSRQ